MTLIHTLLLSGPGLVPSSVAVTSNIMFWYPLSWFIGRQVISPLPLSMINLLCRPTKLELGLALYTMRL